MFHPPFQRYWLTDLYPTTLPIFLDGSPGLVPLHRLSYSFRSLPFIGRRGTQSLSMLEIVLIKELQRVIESIYRVHSE